MSCTNRISQQMRVPNCTPSGDLKWVEVWLRWAWTTCSSSLAFRADVLGFKANDLSSSMGNCLSYSPLEYHLWNVLSIVMIILRVPVANWSPNSVVRGSTSSPGRNRQCISHYLVQLVCWGFDMNYDFARLPRRTELCCVLRFSCRGSCQAAAYVDRHNPYILYDLYF